MSATRPVLELFADGSCDYRDRIGGWAFILRDAAGRLSIERSGSAADTTNNRMELMGVIEGLRKLSSPCKVTITSDSQYVSKGASEWLKGWKRRGWLNAEGKDVKNRDLWEELDRLLFLHEVTWVWVRGHQGHEENERCDVLAGDASRLLRESLAV